jgi:hypothetical protein
LGINCEEGNEMFSNLPLNDQVAINRFLSYFEDKTKQDQTNSCQIKAAPGDLSILESLVSASLHMLMFGGIKKHIGVKCLEVSDLLGLTQIAPGVFHMPYLNVIQYLLP